MCLFNTLDSGRKAFACFATLRGVRAAQILANTDLDAVFIDCEHGHIADIDMHDMVCAVAGANKSPVVRIKDLTKADMKRALDTGAHGILVPMISTAEQAQVAVQLSRFPPIGVRGQGSPFACFEHGLKTPAEYVKLANERVLIMAQIETKEGIENIEAICQVEGLDTVIIGPNDLALSLLGYLPATNEPHYHEAIEKVVTTARRYGKRTGIVVTGGGAAKKALETFDLIVLSADVRALQAWYKQELNIAKAD